jgi:hypothetical protein
MNWTVWGKGGLDTIWSFDAYQGHSGSRGSSSDDQDIEFLTALEVADDLIALGYGNSQFALS